MYHPLVDMQLHTPDRPAFALAQGSYLVSNPGSHPVFRRLLDESLGSRLAHTVMSGVCNYRGTCTMRK